MYPQQSSRIDLADMKAQIVKRLGPERSKKYFYYLNRLLSEKLSKGEFDKLCYRVLGRENLQVHNQFIWSILKNVCHAKGPPPIHEISPTKSAIQVAKSSPIKEDVHEQNGTALPSQHQHVPIWSNGVLPVSPKKVRSGFRDRKLRDRPSPLGPNGKVECFLHRSSVAEEGASKGIMENGEITQCDYERPLQHLEAVAEQPANIKEALVQHASEKPRIAGKDQIEAAVVEDGEEVDQFNHLNFSRIPLVAPLGIPYCSASIGGARKTLPVGSTGDLVSYFDTGGLPDTETLRKRMEQIAVAQGLGEVSMECANMLNNMLDVYLKRLIRSCVELVGARSACDLRKQPAYKQQVQGKVINGMWLANHLNTQSGNGSLGSVHEQNPERSISIFDVRLAMELNPQQLGEDWPLLLEKICMQAFEE